MRFGLTEATIKRIHSVFQEFAQLRKVTIYGSRVKGNCRPGSDIDLALIGEGLDLEFVNSIRSRLDELSLPYTFDICIYDQITDDDLVDHIETVGEIFYCF